MKETLLQRLANLMALAKGTSNKNESETARLAANRIRARLQNEFGMSAQAIDEWLRQKEHAEEKVEEPVPPPPPPPPHRSSTHTEPNSVWQPLFNGIADVFSKSTADKLSPNENFGSIKKVNKGLYFVRTRLTDLWQANLLKYAARRAGCFFSTRQGFLDAYVIGIKSEFVQSAIDFYQAMEEDCIELTEKKFKKMYALLDSTGVLQRIFYNAGKVFRSVFLLGVSSSAEMFRSNHNVEDVYDKLEPFVDTARDRWIAAIENGDI
jgi:hypothetical protein